MKSLSICSNAVIMGRTDCSNAITKRTIPLPKVHDPSLAPHMGVYRLILLPCQKKIVIIIKSKKHIPLENNNLINGKILFL